MLESLSIRNYAIIDEISVDFSGGLTVITGETGAGKSIIVDALELALGARASAEMIRAGADELEISCVFTLDDVIRTGDFPVDGDENVLVLRRVVRADGTGKCFINDRQITLKALKKIGDCLVDLHGQHDHQSLLDVAEHITFLDGFGEFEELEEEVNRLNEEFLSVRSSIGEMKRRIENARRDRELYGFQIKEIDEANIVRGADMELEQTIRRLSRAAELKKLSLDAFQVLSESEGSIEEVLGGLVGSFDELSKSDHGLVQFTERIGEMISGVSDLADALRRYADDIEDDPLKLAEMEERLAVIERMKKKYGPSIEDIFTYRERIGNATEGIENDVQKLEALEIRLEEIKPKLFGRAIKLSCDRKNIAPKLASEVESHLAELGMKDARLVIAIDEWENGEKLESNGQTVILGRGGIDRVEFMFTANPGVPPRPLARIASGGEVSRVMLSLKLALSDVDSVPAMIFDEIDSGVSGRVAEAVGNKLRKLSENRQVVVITHLPQIAGKAASHFSARKTVEKGRTQATLVALDDEMRQEELASMLSGETLTDAAFTHAKELMKVKESRHKA